MRRVSGAQRAWRHGAEKRDPVTRPRRRAPPRPTGPLASSPANQLANPNLEAIRPLAVTVERAAYMLGVHRATLYKLVMRGEIESFTVGRARRIALVTLESWIVKRTGQPT